MQFGPCSRIARSNQLRSDASAIRGNLLTLIYNTPTKAAVNGGRSKESDPSESKFGIFLAKFVRANFLNAKKETVT